MTALAIELDRSRKAEHERLELERQVLHAQKLESLGVLAGGIAHDFNNLLSVILGNAELALSELPDGSPLNPYLEDIRDIGIQAGDLAAQMLAYSGKGSFRVRPIDISTVLGELSRLIQSTISKKVSVEIDLAQAVPLVEADVTQIRQVMLNLIINASDAIGNNAGLIRLSTRTIARGDPSLAQDQFFGHPMGAGEYVCLEVSDSGCGMTQAVMEKLFDPFFTTKRTGRGLGMSAALGIARGHGGCFAIASEPGTGTRLKLLLPSSAHASPKHAELPA
jgi:signal transduction histidine kinase